MDTDFIRDEFGTMEKNVSVIIPTYYRYNYLSNILVSLSKQTVVPTEIIVADQTPFTDRPPDFYEKLKNKMAIRVLNVSKPSLTTPRNLSAKEATGDVLLFLDDDIVISNDFVESHLCVMEEEHVDVVNGAVTLKNELPNEYPWDVSSLDPVRFFLAAPNYKWEGMMLGLTSGNVSIKKEIFFAVGGFDENLPRMVDFELGFRLFRYGAKIYFSFRPFARHLRGDGGSRKNPHNYDKFTSALYIHKKHFPGWITTQFIIKNLLRKRIFIEPWLPLKILHANVKVNRLLKLSDSTKSLKSAYFLSAALARRESQENCLAA